MRFLVRWALLLFSALSLSAAEREDLRPYPWEENRPLALRVDEIKSIGPVPEYPTVAVMPDRSVWVLRPRYYTASGLYHFELGDDEFSALLAAIQSRVDSIEGAPPLKLDSATLGEFAVSPATFHICEDLTVHLSVASSMVSNPQPDPSGEIPAAVVWSVPDLELLEKITEHPSLDPYAGLSNILMDLAEDGRRTLVQSYLSEE